MEYQKDWEHLISRITELRKAKGWSIQALADHADIERANLSRIESGVVTNMYFSTICKIAEALGVKPSDLVR